MLQLQQIYQKLYILIFYRFQNIIVIKLYIKIRAHTKLK